MSEEKRELEARVNEMADYLIRKYKLHDIVDIIKLSFKSLEPNSTELHFYSRLVVEALLYLKFGFADIRLMPAWRIPAMELYHAESGIFDLREYLLSKGYREITSWNNVDEFYYSEYNSFYTAPDTAKCYYSDLANMVFLCDNYCLVRNDRKRILLLSSHY